ncbi:hypothetical protein [Nocardioides montaniterrae]
MSHPDTPDPDTPDSETGSISDDQLPEDLVPGPDNPLAEGLPPGDAAEGLMDPDQSTHRTNTETQRN